MSHVSRDVTWTCTEQKFPRSSQTISRAKVEVTFFYDPHNCDGATRAVCRTRYELCLFSYSSCIRKINNQMLITCVGFRQFRSAQHQKLLLD